MEFRRKVLMVVLVAVFMLAAIGPVAAEEQKQININTATVEQLTQLKRIGPAYAQKIVDFREKHGPFQKPEDVLMVQGIGQKTLEVNKDVICVK